MIGPVCPLVIIIAHVAVTYFSSSWWGSLSRQGNPIHRTMQPPASGPFTSPAAIATTVRKWLSIEVHPRLTIQAFAKPASWAATAALASSD